MPDRPNLLVILSDQLRRGALGCYGDPNHPSPHTDAMAARGVRFANACSTYPICVPFRFTFMTGHYGHSRDVPGIKWRLSPAERTLADDFNDARYDTLYVGKWHLYGGLGEQYFHRPVPREHQGRWKTWLGFEFRNGHFDTCYFENDDPRPRKLDGYQTDALTGLMTEHLVKRRDRPTPFACVLSVEPPHFPYEAPPDLEEKWLARDIALPPNFMVPGDFDPGATGRFWRPRSEADRADVLRRGKLYYAMVENLDRNVGRIMSWLREAGLDRDTIVVFTSDHGELGGSHAMEEKQYPYEESCGVPLIVWGPGAGIPTGKVIDEPTCSEDLYPTFLGLCGARPRDPLPGTDRAPRIRGERASLDRPGVMLEFVLEVRAGFPFHESVYRGFRSPRYKYTVLGDAFGGMKPWQFFDLQSDPHEMRNLIGDAASRAEIERHHAWLRARMAETLDHGYLAPAWGQPGLNERAIEPTLAGYDKHDQRSV